MTSLVCLSAPIASAHKHQVGPCLAACVRSTAIVAAIAVAGLGSAPPAVAAGGPTGYTACAPEGATCVLATRSDVAYGADGSFVFAYGEIGGMVCSNATFGRDPAPGVPKACYAKQDVAPAGYLFCAAEGQTCSPPVSATVAFGATGTYLYQSVANGGISCSNGRFGSDPAPGVPKDCYFEPVLSTVEGQTLSTEISVDRGANGSPCTVVSVSVNWGDGSISGGSPGPATPAGTAMYASHGYQEEGTYTGSVTWQESCDFFQRPERLGRRPRALAADRSSAFVVHVADSPLTLTPVPVGARPGVAFTRVIAVLRDADTAATQSEYAATIHWGDGTRSAAAVAAVGNASFSIAGSHTYRHAGAFSLTVAVSDTGGATATTTTSAIASGPVRPPCDPTRGCAILGAGPPRCTAAHPCTPPVPPPTLGSTPQLCGPLATLPWSNGTPCTIKATTVGKQTEIVISNPVVDRAAYVYPQVVFKPGDVVTFHAGGCVQTGGHGKTWKRYVNPSGPNSGADWPGLYHGTVFIPAALLDGQTVTSRSISDVINRTATAPIEIPAPSASRPPQPLSVLTLGYRDDDPSNGRNNNGYYGHNGDEGTGHQCPTQGDDGGNAWVVIDVVHGPPHPPPPPPPPKAFDLVAPTYDDNGAAINPVWGWQIPGTPELGHDYNGVTGHYEEDCGVLAPPQPKPNAPPRPIQIAARGSARANKLVLYHPWPQNPAPASCTSQTTQVNPPPEGVYGLANTLFGAGICQNGNGDDAGHLNWEEAAYTGTITWRPGSPSPKNYREVLEWSGNWPQDNDYNLSLKPPDAPRLPYLAGVTPPQEGSIGLEFLSNETIDQFSGALPWWKALHAATDLTLAPIPQAAAYGNQWLIDHLLEHRIVALGTMGLDLVHGSPASEIHPVHGLAIEENGPPADPASDTWAFFIRNWGNEGFCSTDQVNLDEHTVVLRLPPPPGLGGGLPGQLPEVTWQSGAAGGASTARVGVSADGTTVLIANLPEPNQHGWVAGEITLHWPTTGPVRATPHPTVPPTAPRPRCGASLIGANGEDGPEAKWRTEYNALSATQRRVYCELVPASFPNGTVPHSHPTPLALSPWSATEQPLQPALTMEYDPRVTANIIAGFNALGVSRASKQALGTHTPCAIAATVLRSPSVLVTPHEPAFWRAPKPIAIERRLSKATVRALRQRMRSCRQR